MNEFKFNGHRLQFARKRRGLAAKEVADSLKVTTRTFSNYENEQRDPGEKIIGELSKLLEFPTSFFYLDDIVSLNPDCVSFRSLARMSAKVRDKALCSAQIALEFSSWLDSRFELPEPILPHLQDLTPEAAAEALRNEWSIGTQPVNNIIHLLESKGVKIFSLDEETDDMDGFSFWQDSTPFIFLNTQKSMERSRFDAAHELGHLILHKHGSPKGKEVESEANRFASAFLMPEAAILSYSRTFITLNWIFQAKKFWRVSATALIRRLRDIELLTEWNYRTMVIQLSKNGYSKKEPNPIQEREFSKLFPMIFSALKAEHVDKQKIADNFCVYPNELDKLLFNLTLTQIYGRGESSTSKANTSNHLRLVE